MQRSTLLMASTIGFFERGELLDDEAVGGVDFPALGGAVGATRSRSSLGASCGTNLLASMTGKQGHRHRWPRRGFFDHQRLSSV